MKKALLIALAVVIVLTGSAVWIWRGTGVTDAAVLVPAETAALAVLPDLPRSILRWPQTTLAKIGVEPEMKAFLEKPFQYLTKNRGGEEASGVLLKLKPGRIFAAAVSVTHNESAVLIGFQYWGGKIAHDAAVARLRQELAQGSPVPELTRESHQGDEIASTTQKGLTIYNASHGQWGFLSNNLPAIKDALDRASGRKKDGSLAESARYKDVMGHLLPEPDFLFFSQPRPFWKPCSPSVIPWEPRQFPGRSSRPKKLRPLAPASNWTARTCTTASLSCGRLLPTSAS